MLKPQDSFGRFVKLFSIFFSFFLSFNFYWSKSNNHYKDQVSNYTTTNKQQTKREKERKIGQSSLIPQEFYITNTCTNTVTI